MATVRTIRDTSDVEPPRTPADYMVEAARVVRRSIATLNEFEETIARERAYLRDRLQELQFLADEFRRTATNPAPEV